ncbi:MAG: YlmC/YmxH family sporulation protein [Butyricicoccus pullicaecorum]|jgi:YlmC/YmxH family sporulation protein|nr:YlmC/YmxH family sporulation protein [Butyricicoccus pullicaecorum]
MPSNCRIADLRCKEVINLCDGCRLGFVGDVEIDILCGRVVALIVPGRCRFFGLFGRAEDFIIPWECIDKIGDDIILVRHDHPVPHRERKKWRMPGI